MNILLDTNIFLEIILDQEKSAEAKSLLLLNGNINFYISDFALHSIGLLLFQRHQHIAFEQFVDDVILNGGISALTLSVQDLKSVIEASREFKLDFDDAYQYVAAIKYDLSIVSYDEHFDRTTRGRKTPNQILQRSI